MLNAAAFVKAALPLASCCLLFAGCANPKFGVPYSQLGYPDATDINKRIRCEIAAMVGDDSSFHPGKILRVGNYRIAAVLSLGIKRVAGLRPNLTFTDVGTVTRGVANVDIAPNITRTIDRNGVTYLSYSVQEIYNSSKVAPEKFVCPPVSSDLAGDLGIADLVATSMSLPIQQDVVSPGGEFGGTITFTTNLGVSGGPTWILNRFRGPGGSLGSASSEYTNKLTVAFFQQPRGKTDAETNSLVRAEALRVLQSIVDQDISRQLSTYINIR
jgi:hypothetical protein